MGLPAGSKRLSGDWPKELEELQNDPVRMLLAAVVLRAKSDSGESRSARRFLRRVEANCAETGEAGWAVIAAMHGRSTEPPRHQEHQGARGGMWGGGDAEGNRMGRIERGDGGRRGGGGGEGGRAWGTWW
jgi:hypothetical protein